MGLRAVGTQLIEPGDRLAHGVRDALDPRLDGGRHATADRGEKLVERREGRRVLVDDGSGVRVRAPMTADRVDDEVTGRVHRRRHDDRHRRGDRAENAERRTTDRRSPHRDHGATRDLRGEPLRRRFDTGGRAARVGRVHVARLRSGLVAEVEHVAAAGGAAGFGRPDTRQVRL